jgi:peptidoglycan/xylan/chitin deacetylase (PgdA/CDA1 family)
VARTAAWVPLAAATAGMAWAVRGRSSQVFGRSYWHGPRSRRAIALTFDDGPSESTPAILDILARHNAPATFFQCGKNVLRLPEISRSIMGAGHQLGNHTHTHPYLFLRSPREIYAELRLTQEAIHDTTGVTPDLFRAPYGARWFGLGAAQRRLGLCGVMWSVIGYDWSLNADAVVTRTARSVSNGAILCLHDGREMQVNPDINVTVQAVRRLIPMLLDQGYKFETVDRLLCPMN